MRIAGAVMVLILVAGCSGERAKIPAKAAPQVPVSWRDTVGTEVDVSADWWRQFDPVLAKMVEKALASNDDLAIAIERVSEARADFRLANAQQLPNIIGAAKGGRDRDLSPAFGTPEIQTAGTGNVEISYDIDIFGRLADTKAAFRSALLAREDVKDSVRLAVTASTAIGYINLRSLDSRLEILQSTLAARAEGLKVAKRRAQAGYSSDLDLAQAESDYYATEQQIPPTELAIRRQEDGLSILMGDAPHSIDRGVELEAIAEPNVPVMLPASLLRRRPDIAAAEQQLATADHSLDVARDAFMPDIQLSAAGGFFSSNLPPVSPIAIWSVGGSILAPIFSAGRLEAQQDSAVARRDEAAFAYRKAALEAFKEVEDALAAVQRDAEQERALVAERDVLARTLNLARNRYRAGYAPYLDQLDAQRGLLGARLALAQVRSDLLNADVTLFQALGGGWTPRSDAKGEGLEGSAWSNAGVFE